MGPVAPVEGELEFRVAPQAGLAAGVEFGRVAEPAQHAGGVRFPVAPFPQAIPESHQALVGEVHDGVRLEFIPLGRHQEGGAGGAEGGEGGRQFVGRRAGDRAKVGEAGRPADAAAPLVGESAEGGGAGALPVRREGGEDLLGVLVEGVGEGADGVVVDGLDGADVARCLPVGPGLGEGVLEQGKLVRVVAHVVHQPGE